MKEDGLEQLMAAYQQAGKTSQKTIDTANRILQVNPNNLRALALLAAYNRQIALQGGPQAQSTEQAEQYGTKGLQALHNMTKPEGMSDADFVKLHNNFTAIFDGAVAFAALQKNRTAGRWRSGW